MESAVVATAVIEPVASTDALPVCLWKENPNRLVSLWDMLKRYAFSFYKVITHIEDLRHRAKSLGGSSDYPGLTQNKLFDDDLKAFTAVLVEMRAECGNLDLISTTDLISHIESEVHKQEKNYNYAGMLNHLDTLLTFA
jgi:hypothetical protein